MAETAKSLDRRRFLYGAGGAVGLAASGLLTRAAVAADATPLSSGLPEGAYGMAALESLPGVGPSTAKAIIAHRQANGPFGKIEGLLDVKGIGDGKFAEALEAWCAASLPVDHGDVDAACRALVANLGAGGWLRYSA